MSVSLLNWLCSFVCVFLYFRKVVVLQKKEEEAFGFEIQVRWLTATYGRISQPPQLILTGFDLITADDS